MTTRYDTIVVGAGLAGLVATTTLAQAGKRVLLVERNAELGGRARTDELGGTLFNQGGHALYRNGVGHQALLSLGVDPAGAVPPLAGNQFMMDGQATAMPYNARSMLKTKAMSPRSKAQFGWLLGSLGRVKPNEFAGVSVDEWLAPYRADVQQAAKAVIRLSTYSAATDLMSADAAIVQLQVGATEGVLYLHDGWGSLCGELVAVATQAGAHVRSGVKVTNVASAGQGYCIETAEEDFDADTVIVAAGGPAFSARMLGVDQAVFGRVGAAPEAAVLDLVLDAVPTQHRFVLGVDEPTFFSVHGPPARLGPKERIAAVAMRYIGPADHGSADEHRASLERIAQVAGVGQPLQSRFLRRMTVTNGLPLATEGGMAGRPAIHVPNMPGAFIAGDWVGPRGLLADAALASGADAAAAVLQTIRTQVGAH